LGGPKKKWREKGPCKKESVELHHETPLERGVTCEKQSHSPEGFISNKEKRDRCG